MLFPLKIFELFENLPEQPIGCRNLNNFNLSLYNKDTQI